MSGQNSDMNQIPDRQPQKAKVSTKELAAKYRSKREIYNFLATDYGV